MEYVDELIEKTRTVNTLKEGYELEKEILNFLHDNNVKEDDKQKLRSEGFLEAVTMISDGYKHKYHLEHYSK